MMKTPLKIVALLVAASLWSVFWNYVGEHRGFGWRFVVGALGYVPLSAIAVAMILRRFKK